MKKLMTMIAAVATAFGLYAGVADGSTGTSFEGTEIAAGPLADALAKIVELPDTTGSAAELWSGLADSVKIAKYTGSDHYDESKRAWQFDANTGVETPWNNYLNLASGSDLTRYLNTSHTGHDVAEGTNNKIYFDSLVKFTAFDEDPSETIDTDAKIALWLQEDEDAGKTNLFVRINGTSYECDTEDAGNLLDTWARVTVKALPINDTKIGFVVFVDQQLQSSGDLDYTGLNLNAIAQDYANKKALFPLTAQGATTQISSVGFKGTGAIDEIVFSTTDPFDNAVDANVIKVVLNTEFAVQVSSNGEDWVNAPANFNLGLLKDGKVYFKGDATHCDGSVDASEAAAGDIIEIEDSDVSVAKATFDNGTTTTKFSSAQAAANAAITDGTLLLLENAEAIAIPAGAANAVIIDLNGNELTGSDQDSTIMALEAAIVVSNGVVSAAAGQSVILSVVGCTIEGGTFNGEFACEGTFKINDGRFSDDSAKTATIPPEKQWKAEKVGGYWELEDKPKTITVTVGPVAQHAIVSVVSNTVATTLGAGTYTLPAGDSLTVTYAADTGYTFDAQAITEFVLKVNGDKSTCPEVTAVNYEISFNEGCQTIVYTIETQTPIALPTPAATDKGEFLGWTNLTYTTPIKSLTALPNPLANIAFLAAWKQGGVPVDPQDQPKTDDGAKNLKLLNDLLGDQATTWATAVYGTDMVPGSKLDASNPDLIKAAAAYNLKVMASPVTITPAATTDGKFTFALSDANTDNPVVAATLAQALMVYTSDLKVDFARDPEGKAVEAEVSEELIKVGFTGNGLDDKAANAGFMKVDLSVGVSD